MMRPNSIHTVHADVSLTGHGRVKWVDTTAVAGEEGRVLSRPLRVASCRVWDAEKAEALEAYKCTSQQAGWVLQADVPIWAEEAGEGLWRQH